MKMNEAKPAPGARAIRLSPEDTPEEVMRKAALVRPDARQVAWQQDEFSAFVHFGMNTFTDREWGDGREDPALFNPVELDARQWVAAAKAAGMKRMILTAKHHDGFCLWPSKFTRHSVKFSPWKNGQGDVVGEFVEACRAGGMHYGIYISPWDRHEPSYGDSPSYNRYFLNQLEEVLTTYEGIQEVWFDGACAEGPNGKRQEYDWPAYWALIRRLAPQATISVRGPDVRWCGNEAGIARKDEWSVVPLLPAGADSPGSAGEAALPFGPGPVPESCYLYDIFGEDLGSRDVLVESRKSGPYLAWYPCQVNTSIRPGWFYHEHEDSRVRSLADLFGIWRSAVGGNSQFLLNLPPDRRGLLHETDVRRLEELGRILKAGLESRLPVGAAIRVEVATKPGDPVSTGLRSVPDGQEIAALLDGRPDTSWAAGEGSDPVTITVELPGPVQANCLLLQEHIPLGQRIEGFTLEVRNLGNWQQVAAGSSVGYKRLVSFPDGEITALRVVIDRFRLPPVLSNLDLLQFPALLSAPLVVRDARGMVTIQAPAGAFARYTLDGTEPDEKSPRASHPIPLSRGGVVCTRSWPLTPGNGLVEDSGATIRMELGPCKSGWRIHECDGQAGGQGSAARAIDDDPGSIWWSAWDPAEPPSPHVLVVDLGENLLVNGFTYLPRQDRVRGGIVLKARFETSLDGREWTAAIGQVGFDNVVNSRQQQVCRLASPCRARYFRMISLQTTDGNHSASAADISVLVEQGE